MGQIVTSSGYALSLASPTDAALPVTLWRNDALAYAADGAATGFPASSLGTVSTLWAEGWRGANADPQSIVVTLDPTVVADGIGLARSNFASDGTTLSIDAVEAGGDPEEPTDWVEIVADHVPAADGIVLHRLTPGYFEALRLNITPVSLVPQLAVLRVGKLLVMERGIQPSAPLNWGRSENVVGSVSQGNDLLGVTVTDVAYRTSVPFSVLSGAWIRSSGFLDFAASARKVPFFFAGRPEAYPGEVCYARAGNNLIPDPNHLADYSSLSIDLEGIVA